MPAPDSRAASSLDIADALSVVFGARPNFVTYDLRLRDWLREQELDALVIDEVDEASAAWRQNVVLLSTDYGRLLPYPHFQHLFGDSRVLVIPFASFDPSFDAATYWLTMLASSDIRASTAGNHYWMKVLQSEPRGLLCEGEQSFLDVDLRDQINIFRPRTTPLIEEGEWEGIGTFFEVPMTFFHTEAMRPGYNASGELMVDGIVIARHRGGTPDVPRLAADGWSLFDRLRKAGSFPLRVVIQESFVRQVVAGSEDITAEVARVANDPPLVLVELAMSTNESLPLDGINWSLNAQVNEGLAGIHVGVGNGLSGAHIDFVCPGVAVTPKKLKTARH